MRQLLAAVLAVTMILLGITVVAPVASAATAPGAPTGLAGAAGNASVGLTWTAPSNNGGATITDYRLQYKLTSTSTWSTFTDGVSTATSGTVSGLTNGSAYNFQVAAINSVGVGTYSTSVTATPRTTPGAPTALSLTPGNGQLSASWTAPAATGGAAITDYQLQYKLGTDSTWTTFTHTASTATSLVVTGLSNGSTYDVRVAAVNTAGPGTSSSTATATPRTSPGAPTGLTLTPGNGQIAATWTAPSTNGGAAISDYQIQYKATSSSTWSTWTHTASTATSATITGLSNGTGYDVRVAAVNSQGAGPTSSVASGTPRTTAGAPTGLAAAGGDQQLALTWTAPADIGGAAISDYQVQYKLSSDSSWSTFAHTPSTTTSLTVTGLVNGASYDARVAALNPAGTSAWSTTATATPRTVPAAPTGLTLTAGAGQLLASWTAPTSNGGAAISDYQVQFKPSSDSSWTTFPHTASTTTSLNVTGLTNGTSYDVRVAAVNSVGVGAGSAAATATARTVPAAPTGLNVTTASSSALTASWTPPADNGGAVVSDYRVQYKLSSDTTWTTFTHPASTATSQTITGLTLGSVYDVRVAAINAAGAGPDTAPVSGTPRTVPGQPGNLLASTLSPISVQLTWAAPASDGGSPITGYQVGYVDNGTPVTNTVAATPASVTINGLASATAYTFTVRAINTLGTGPNASVTATTPKQPVQPPVWSSTVDVSPASVSTVAGSGDYAHADGTGSGASFQGPGAMHVVGGFGYVSDNGWLRKVNLATGQVTTVGGTDYYYGSCYDSTNPSDGSIRAWSLTDDGVFLYWLDTCNSVGGDQRIRRMNLDTGEISTVASLGTINRSMAALTVGPDGSLYYAYDSTISKVDTVTGTLTATADLTNVAGVGGPAVVRSMTADASKLWVLAFSGNTRVLVSVNPGNGSTGVVPNSIAAPGYGQPGYLSTSSRIVSAGDYLYATTDSQVLRFSKVSGAWTNVAGTSGSGYRNGTGAKAWFYSLQSIATDGTNLYVSEAAGRIRKLSAGTSWSVTQPSVWSSTVDVSPASVSTVAGSGDYAHADGTGSGASFQGPGAMHVVGGFGYVSDNGWLRKVNLATGQVTTVGGTDYYYGSCYDSTNPSDGSIRAWSLTDDGVFLYWLDTCNSVGGDQRIRRMNLDTGEISTVASLGTINRSMAALTVGPDGSLYYAYDSTISKVDTVTGTLTATADLTNVAGVGGPAVVRSMTADASKLWVLAFSGNTRVLVSVNPGNGSTGVVPNSIAAPGYGQPGYLSTSSRIVSAGDYLYATTDSQVLRFSKVSGAWTNVAGTSGSGYRNGTGAKAWFYSLQSIATDGTNLYVSEAAGRIRKLSAGTSWSVTQPSVWSSTVDVSPASVSTVAGSGDYAHADGTGAAASFQGPGAMHVVGGFGYVSDNGWLRKVNLATGQVTTVGGTDYVYSSCTDTLNPSDGSIRARSLTDDGSFLYWLDNCSWAYSSDQRIRRMDLDTGEISTISRLGPIDTSMAALTVGSDGSLYYAYDSTISKVDTVNGTFTSIATLANVAGMDGPAVVRSMTADASKLWVLAFNGNTRVLVSVNPSNGSTSVVPNSIAAPGNDQPGYLSTSSRIVSAGDYLYAINASRVLRFSKGSGAWTNVAGTSGSGYRNGTGAKAWFYQLAGIATDGTNLYLAEASGRIRKLSAGASWPVTQPSSWSSTVDVSPAAVSTVAGSGDYAHADGTGASASFQSLGAMHVIGGYGYASDNGWLRKVNLATGQVTTVGGSDYYYGSCYDSTNPLDSSIRSWSLADDGAFLYWLDACSGGYGSDRRIRRMDLATGETSTVSSLGPIDTSKAALTVGPDGSPYYAYDSTISKVDTVTGTFTSIATLTDTNSNLAMSSDGQFLWVLRRGCSSSGGDCTQLVRVNPTTGAWTNVHGTSDNTELHGTGAMVSAGAYLYGRVDDTRPVITNGNTQWVPFRGIGRWTKATGELTLIRNSLGQRLVGNSGDFAIAGISTDGDDLVVTLPGEYRIAKLRYTPPVIPGTDSGWGAEAGLGSAGGGNLAASTDGCRCVGKPVDMESGNQFENQTDLAVPGRGPALAFTRSYDTRRASLTGRLGSGWTDSYDWRLTIDDSTSSPSNGAAVVKQANGSQTTFYPADGGTYIAPATIQASLVRNSDQSWTYTLDRSTKYRFNPSGYLTSITDRNGYATTLSYSGTNLTAVTDPAGRTLQFTYDSSNRIATITDPANRVLTYTYDSAGNLATVTNLAGGQWEFGYDGSHRLTSMTNPRGFEAVTSYDGLGRVDAQTDYRGKTTTFAYAGPDGDGVRSTTVTHPEGNKDRYVYAGGHVTSQTTGHGSSDASTTTYTYDEATGAVASIADNADHTTTFTYDQFGNRLTATDALQRTTTTTYNGFNQPLTVTDPSGVTTTSTYDSTGNLLTVSRPLTGTGGPASTVSSSYTYGDPARPGDLTATTDARGKTTSFTYDTYGNQTSSTDPTGRTTTFTYNTIGWLTSTVSPEGNKNGGTPAARTTSYSNFTGAGQPQTTTDALGHQTQTEYDHLGNTSKVTDAEGRYTTTLFDGEDQPVQTAINGQTTSTTGYDDNGNPASTADALGHATTYAYDDLDRPTAQTDPLGHTTTFTYDDAGNRTEVTDPLGHTTTTVYDAAGQATTATDAEDRDTRYAYDALGRVTSVTDAQGRKSTTSFDSLGRRTTSRQGKTSPLTVTGSWTYDPAGNVLTATDGQNATTTYTYDDTGRLTTSTDPLGRVTSLGYDADGNTVSTTRPTPTGSGTQVTTRAYDAVDRLTGIDYPTGTPDVTYTYDDTGLRTAMSDGAGATTYTYDTRGRLTGTNRTHPSSGTRTVGYGYDAADRQTSITYPNGETVTRTYDNDDRLHTVTDWDNRTTTWDWNADDTTAAVHLPNGVDTDYTYDDTALTTKIDTVNSGNGGSTAGTVADRRYSYDDTGLLTAVSDMSEPTNPVGHAYTWDNRSRLNETTTSGTGPATNDAGTHSFDDANHLTGALGATFTVDIAGQLTTASYPATSTRPAATAGFTFDQHGNRTHTATTLGTGGTATTRDQGYGYDAADRLTVYSDTDIPNTAVGYTYDGDGLRATRTRTTGTGPNPTSTTKTWTWDTTGDLAVLLDDDTHTYLYGPDNHPYAQITNTSSNSGPVAYLHADAGGATIATTNNAGVTTATWSYDPYGNVTTHTGADTTTFLYAGENTDPDSGLVYLRARDYDPTTATFTTRDPLEDTTATPYAYTDGNPLQYADPTGLIWGAIDGATCHWWLLNCGGAGTAVAESVTGTFDGFSFGLTRGIRHRVGIDDRFLDCSATYKQSRIGGTAAGVAALPLDVIGVISLVSKAKVLFGAAREARLVYKARLAEIPNTAKTGREAWQMRNEAKEVARELGPKLFKRLAELRNLIRYRGRGGGPRPSYEQLLEKYGGDERRIIERSGVSSRTWDRLFRIK